MNRTLALLAFAFALAAPARAQFSTTGLPVVPLGSCQLIAPAAATKLSSCTAGIPKGANLAVIRTETQAIRYRDDGTAPTATIGQPILTADPPFVYLSTLSALQIIQQGASATVNVVFYKSP
jgi:hypothetical protein